MVEFNKLEKEVIIHSLKENIKLNKLRGGDIPYTKELIENIDRCLTKGDLNLIEYCIGESYEKAFNNLFMNEYSETLDEIGYKIFLWKTNKED